MCVCAYACAFVCVFASACAFVCVRACASAFVCVRVRSCGCGCMCIRVSEAEVAWLFHQTLVRTPVWECAGIRSCANRRILLCKEPPDTRSPPKGVAGERSLSFTVHLETITICTEKGEKGKSLHKQEASKRKDGQGKWPPTVTQRQVAASESSTAHRLFQDYIVSIKCDTCLSCISSALELCLGSFIV